MAVEPHGTQPTQSAVPPRDLTPMSTKHPTTNYLQIYRASPLWPVSASGRCGTFDILNVSKSAKAKTVKFDRLYPRVQENLLP